jgi:hypothetical protein
VVRAWLSAIMQRHANAKSTDKIAEVTKAGDFPQGALATAKSPGRFLITQTMTELSATGLMLAMYDLRPDYSGRGRCRTIETGECPCTTSNRIRVCSACVRLPFEEAQVLSASDRDYSTPVESWYSLFCCCHRVAAAFVTVLTSSGIAFWYETQFN